MALSDRNKELRIEQGKVAVEKLNTIDGNNVHIKYYVKELENLVEKQQKQLNEFNSFFRMFAKFIPSSIPTLK